MSKVKLPDRIFGQWIAAETPAVPAGKITWLRKTFFCEHPGDDAALWITATGGCQIFINGRLTGFGPRPHPQKDSLYIEEYEINDFLEKGENVIAAVLIHGAEHRELNLHPGLWCQAVSGHGELFGSDDSWLLHDGSLPEGNAPRFTAEFAPQLLLPGAETDAWKLPLFRPEKSWNAPEQCRSLEELPCRFELHPLPAPAIGIEHPAGTLACTGRVSGEPVFSSFCFRNLKEDNSVRGAVGWVFAESPTACTAALHSDDPYRLFCNNDLVSFGDCCSRTLAELSLKPGWNRLLVYQKPRQNSMGMLLLFDRKITVLQDMTPEAPAGWLLTSPLHITLENAVPALRLKAVSVVPYNTEDDDFCAQGELLRSSGTELFASARDRMLRRGEFQVFDFQRICYGFPRISIEANTGDTITLLTGVRCGANGLPEGSAEVRGCLTFSCRKGPMLLESFIPVEFRYAALYVQRAKNGVKVFDVSADELQCDVLTEGVFKCADKEFNRIWKNGSAFLRRSAAFIPRRNGMLHNDLRLLDSYIDAANMAAVSGNAEYIATSLRQYFAVQSEDGSIPVLTYGDRGKQQFSHLFFLPVWIVYNYRFSGNRVELERAVEPLDRLREYFEALADDKGLLSALPARFQLHDKQLDSLAPDEISTTVNALYCRFLLSAAEVYSLSGDPAHYRRCHRQAQQIAGTLRELASLPEHRLLADRCKEKSAARCSLAANFYSMYAGITPVEEFENFFHSFFRFDPPEALYPEEESKYLQFLFLEMLFALGQRSWALRYLRTIEMMAETGCGEFLPANVFLLREVLGIRIAEPGHSTVFFNPACKEVRFAEGVVPMARGHLRVRWEEKEDGTLEVILNSSIPIKVVPEMNRSQLARTSFSIGGEVMLLKPPPEILDEEDEHA